LTALTLEVQVLQTCRHVVRWTHEISA